MLTEIIYGTGEKLLELPEGVTVIRKKRVPAIESPERHIAGVLEKPIESAPLLSIARGKRDAVIAVSDNTRPVPNGLLLPPILKTLEEAGVGRIRILIATGLHKPLSSEAIEEILGSDIVSKYEVINHDALSENVSYLGETRRLRFPIYINREYVQADLKILTGLIEPHFMAGYSGGRKSICPGIASVETVKHMHSAKVLESPYAASCVIDENPFHIEALEIAERAGCDFILNVVLNDLKEISGVFGGDLVGAHKEGMAFAHSHSIVSTKRRFKVVITGNGGYPLDRNYYQTVKGLVNCLGILEDEGEILMLSECSDGLGSEYFRAGLGRLREFGNFDAYIDHISDIRNFEIDQWEVEELVKVLRKARIKIYTELPEDDCRLGFAQKVEDSSAYVREVFERIRPEEVAVIPEGPYVVPVESITLEVNQ
jgi:nickel-dependent lactate racemase